MCSTPGPARLRAALRFLVLEPRAPELRRRHRCFDNWRGIGDIVAGMAREEYDLELRRYNGRGWRAIFFQSGFEHSLTSHAGAAWARSPWEAVQQAALDVVFKVEGGVVWNSPTTAGEDGAAGRRGLNGPGYLELDATGRGLRVPTRPPCPTTD